MANSLHNVQISIIDFSVPTAVTTHTRAEIPSHEHIRLVLASVMAHMFAVYIEFRSEVCYINSHKSEGLP